MRTIVWLSALLCFILSPVSVSSVRDADEYFFDQTLGDFTEELQVAKEEGKKGILMFFEMDECPFCHRMKHSILNQSHVQDFFHRNFLIFSIDIEGDTEITDFDGRVSTQKEFSINRFRVRATPVFVFFDLQGRQTTRYVGPVTSVEEFMLLGDYVIKEIYNEKSFLRYKRDKKSSPSKHVDD